MTILKVRDFFASVASYLSEDLGQISDEKKGE